MNYIVLNVCNTPISWFMTSGGFVVVVLVLSFSCVPVRPTQFSGNRQWESEGGLLHSKHIRCVSMCCVRGRMVLWWPHITHDHCFVWRQKGIKASLCGVEKEMS